ncbi:unnamed protein product [Prunus brigantina]
MTQLPSLSRLSLYPSLCVCVSLSPFLSLSLSLFNIKPPLSLSTALYTPLPLSLVLHTIAMPKLLQDTY